MINAVDAKSVHDLVEARNAIQYKADKAGKKAAQKCWEDLKPANALIYKLIIGELTFSRLIGEEIQKSFDQASEGLK
jgi:hypothetical protein